MSSSKYSSNPLKYRPYLQHQPSSFPQKPPLPKSSLLSSHITSAFSQQEEDLFKLALKLYDELFPHILQINENEFLHKLESIILLSLKRNITFPSGTISKIINIIKTNHYEKDYAHINKLIQSIDNMNKYQKLPGNYIIPHCNQMNVSKHPQHPCGEQLYFLTQDLLLCLKCQLIYSVSSVFLHCTHCDEDFYTSVDPDFHKAKYSKATWNKYHCKVLFNEPMKCHQCRDYLHINNTNNKLTCLACNYEIESNNLKSKCVVCGSEFTSEAKRFNKQEKKVVNVVINETLYNKIEAKPPSVPCCGNKLKDLSQYVFTHKKECNGVLYEGQLHQKDIVVCSKCRMLNFKDNHHWMCPLCKERFKLGGDTVAAHNKEYHKVDIPQFKKLNINNDNDDNDSGSKFFIKRANTNFIHGDYSNPRTSRESTAVMENERKKYGYSRNSPSTEENYLRRMNSHTNNKADAIHTQENEIEKNIVLSHARHASNQVMERSNRNRLQGPIRQRSMQFDKEETSEFHNATATSSFKNSFMKGGTPFKNARINLPIYQQLQPQQSSNMFGKLEFNLNNINININVNPDVSITYIYHIHIDSC